MNKTRNPAIRLNDLLAASGATLVRQGNHNVYKLGNGATFVRSKTPSDWRSDLNSISDLRKRAGITAPKPAPAPVRENVTAPIYKFEELPPEPWSDPVPEPPPPPVSSHSETKLASTDLAHRLDELIAAGEEEQADLMDRAAAIESQVAFLRAIRAYADDPMTEALLTLVLPQPITAAPPPPPPAPAPPPPLQPISVTRKATLAVIEGLKKDTFTVHDILEGITNGALSRLSSHEQRRLKNLIAMQLYYHRTHGGNIAIIKGGRGGGLSIWTRVDPATIGTRVEIKSEPITEPEVESETPQE